MDVRCLFFEETESWGCHACGYHIAINVTCEGKGEILEGNGIVEIPSVGNGIDDGVRGGVGFEEAGSASGAQGFCRGVRCSGWLLGGHGSGA